MDRPASDWSRSSTATVEFFAGPEPSTVRSVATNEPNCGSFPISSKLESRMRARLKASPRRVLFSRAFATRRTSASRRTPSTAPANQISTSFSNLNSAEPQDRSFARTLEGGIEIPALAVLEGARGFVPAATDGPIVFESGVSGVSGKVSPVDWVSMEKFNRFSLVPRLSSFGTIVFLSAAVSKNPGVRRSLGGQRLRGAMNSEEFREGFEKLRKLPKLNSPNLVWFRNRCMQALDKCNPRYIAVVTAIDKIAKDCWYPTDRWRTFLPAETATETAELLNRAHRESDSKCRRSDFHRIFEADAIKRYSHSQALIHCSVGTSRMEEGAFLRADRLRDFLGQRRDRCVCELMASVEIFQVFPHSPSYDVPLAPATIREFLPPGWTWRPLGNEPVPKLDVPSTDDGTDRFREACEPFFEIYEAALHGFPRDDFGNRVAWNRVLERAAVETVSWCVLSVALALPNSPLRGPNQYPVRVAVPLPGNESSLSENSFLATHRLCGPALPIGLSRDICVAAEFLDPDLIGCVFLEDTLAMRCARSSGIRSPEVTVVSGLDRASMEDITLVLPIGARLIADDSIARKLLLSPQDYYFAYFQDPDQISSLFEPPWDWILKLELECLYASVPFAPLPPPRRRVRPMAEARRGNSK